MFVRYRMRAASESAVCDSSGGTAVCGDADDDRSDKRAVRSAVESGWMRVLPE